ncbi:SDR family NAD(P)-dependent oxidoreductase [Amycolatopsis kentuckyensis]|uniref:SDR family NAD(P)-dependent oxidoreductase n=1 Tax=Amycolatopsis kentuckyensis TaxID=218823 RepID=UPI00356248D1
MGWELAGQAVLVTGGASGIGLACVRAFAAEGARVGVIDREAGPWGAVADGGSEPAPVGRSPGPVAGSGGVADDRPPPAGSVGNAPGLELARTGVAAELGVAFARADVTDEPAFAAAVDTLARHFGGLDVVVGCAGVSGPVGKPLARTTAAEVAAVLAVNVTGPFLLVKHALPHLADGGSVVLLGSDSAFTAAPGMVPYCASKGAVVALTRALSVEIPGVRVNCVCPSVVDTPMARGDLGDLLDDPVFPVQAAGDVARQVLFLASPASRPVNGQALLADFGMSARSAFPA